MKHLNHTEVLDSTLISQIKQGSRLAFNQLHHRHWKQLYNYTFNILNDPDLTEDVLQEVFTNVWIHRNKGEIQHLKAYLFNACRNNAITKIRQVKFSPIQEEIVAFASISPEIEDLLNLEDLQSVIDEASDGLPERCKQIFYLSRFEHLSISEIARKLNISHRTVENQLSIALKHIRPEISKALYTILVISSI